MSAFTGGQLPIVVLLSFDNRLSFKFYRKWNLTICEYMHIWYNLYIFPIERL